MKAAYAAGHDTIECEVHQGTREDAQWCSFSANKANGFRRTDADKQRAVKAALQHPSGALLSDRQIAKHFGVSDQMVHVACMMWFELLRLSKWRRWAHNNVPQV